MNEVSQLLFLENQYEPVHISSLSISRTSAESPWIKTSDLMWPAVSVVYGTRLSNKANSLHLVIIWSVYVTKITEAGAVANAWAAPHAVQESICHLLKPQSAEWKRLLEMEGVELLRSIL